MGHPTVEIFCVCLEVKPHADGAVDIIGVFNQALVKQFPAFVALTIFGRVRFELADDGEHQLAITVTDLNNSNWPPLEQTFTVNAKLAEEHSWHTFSFGLKDFAFRQWGDLTFRLAIDGKSLASTVVYVKRA
jgi:hypothetical protein